MECPICFENLAGDVFSTPCGHIFCKCVLEIAKSSGNCPTCRQSFSVVQLRKIFLPLISLDDNNKAATEKFAHDLKTEKAKFDEKLAELSKRYESMAIQSNKPDSTLDETSIGKKQLKLEAGILFPKNTTMIEDDLLGDFDPHDCEEEEVWLGEYDPNECEEEVCLGDYDPNECEEEVCLGDYDPNECEEEVCLGDYDPNECEEEVWLE